MAKNVTCLRWPADDSRNLQATRAIDAGDQCGKRQFGLFDSQGFTRKDGSPGESGNNGLGLVGEIDFFCKAEEETDSQECYRQMRVMKLSVAIGWHHDQPRDPT